jgi:hypothetical protein
MASIPPLEMAVPARDAGVFTIRAISRSSCSAATPMGRGPEQAPPWGAPTPGLHGQHGTEVLAGILLPDPP